MTTLEIDQTVAALKAILDDQASAWNRGDATAWSAAFSNDADFVNVLGHAFTGRTSICEQHARIFAGPYLGSKTAVSMRKLSQVSAEIVLLESVHEVTSFKALPPGITETTSGVLKTLMKYVVVERDGAWRIVAAQNTAVLPAPSCH